MPDDTQPPTPDDPTGPDPRDLRRELAEMARLSRQFGNTLSSAFVDATLRGKDLGDVLRSLALRLSEIALKAAFKPLTDALGGGLAGLLGGVVAPRSVGSTALPVPFAPSGTIANPLTASLGASLPAAAAARASATAGPSITFNITTPDADSFRRSETQIAALLARAVGHGQRNL
jgi:hypothetical protein